ncbi:MAG: tetratricopeptide repeat protein [Terracidiphilus sp.]
MTIAFIIPHVDAIVYAQEPVQNLQSLQAEARDAQSRGDFNAAAASYRKAVELEPSVSELWADLGLMEHQTGQFDQAIKSFTEAARLNSSLYVPQLFLGIDNLELKRTQAAIPFLEKAEKLNPKDPQAPFMLGRAFSIAGDSDSSSEEYWRSVALAPGNGNAWLGLGMAYLQRVDSEARVMTSTYLTSNYTKFRAGELFAEQGKLIQAAAAYKEELSLRSPLPCSHAAYGIVLLRQKAIAEAKAEIDRESNLNSGCPLTRLGFAAIKLAQGDTENAMRELIAIWSTDPGFLRDNLPLLRDGITAEQTGKLVDLAKDWQADSRVPQGLVDAIQAGLDPNTPVLADLDKFGADRPVPGTAEILPTPQDAEKTYLSGHFGKCSESLRPRLSVLPEKSLLLLTQCAFYAGDYRTASMAARRLASNATTRLVGLYWESRADQKLAIAALTRAGDLDANSPRMHVLLGDLYRQKRRWGVSESEYRKAIVLEPKNRVARIGLAISLFEDGKSDEAFVDDKDLLQENPEDPEANLLAAEILVQRHQYADAETYLIKCRSNIPAEYMPRIHALLGEVYSNTDRVQQALSEFKLGTKSDADGSVHYQMARLYLKTGDKKAAAEAFQVSKQLREQWDASASVAVGQSGTDISRK